MRLVLGSNIASLQAQRKLGDSSAALTTVFERLSTGQRINRASDDAAGLAVLAKLSTYSKILKRAALNVSDANSLLSIADGALEQVSGMLTRMQELAAQAANGSFNRTQRASLDKEFASLDAEIKRITSSTEFNGLRLFDGEQVQATATQYSQAFNVSSTLTSSNGRFIVATQPSAVPIQGTITDTVTGEVRSFSFGSVQSYSGVDDQGNIYFKEWGSAFFGDGQFKKYDYALGTTVQLTNEANVNALTGATFSADGSTIAFISSTNYIDGQGVGSASGTGVHRLYVMDLASGIIRTSGEQVAGSIVRLSSDGNRAAILSNRIGGQVYAQAEIITASFSPNGISSLQRRTESTSALPLSILGVNNEGSVIFESRRNFTGQNAGNFRQIFTLDSSGDFNQATNFNSVIVLNALTVNLRGTEVYFISSSDLLNDNPLNRNQLFKLDLEAGGLSQLTNYSVNTLLAPTTALSISRDGRFVTSRGLSASNLERFDLSPGRKTYIFEVGQGSKGGISAELESIRSTLSGLGALVISSQQSAGFALDVVGDNLASLSSLRGRIGASQSRLSTAASLVNSQQTEFEAAAGRIKDVDVAFESANLVRLSIQQQAAASILSQANQQPTLALDLLRDI